MASRLMRTSVPGGWRVMPEPSTISRVPSVLVMTMGSGAGAAAVGTLIPRASALRHVLGAVAQADGGVGRNGGHAGVPRLPRVAQGRQPFGFAGGQVGALALVLRERVPLGVAYGIWGASGVALTAILSTLIYGEPLTPIMVGGIVLIILGVLTIELGSQRAARQRQAAS